MSGKRLVKPAGFESRRANQKEHIEAATVEGLENVRLDRLRLVHYDQEGRVRPGLLTLSSLRLICRECQQQPARFSPDLPMQEFPLREFIATCPDCGQE